MFIRLLLISVVLVVLALIFLGIRILFKGNGRFPETHISRNKEMQKRGIKCAQETNIGCNTSLDSGMCSTCGNRLFANNGTQSR